MPIDNVRKMSSLRIFYEFLFGVIILIAFRVCKTG